MQILKIELLARPRQAQIATAYRLSCWKLGVQHQNRWNPSFKIDGLASLGSQHRLLLAVVVERPFHGMETWHNLQVMIGLADSHTLRLPL